MDDRNLTSQTKPPLTLEVANPLRVTHAVLSLEFGGMERVVLELVREGIRRGQQTSVLCLVKLGTLAEQVEALGATVICLDKPPGLRFDFIPKIRAVLRQLKPDVIHTHQIGVLLYTGAAARREKVPVIVHTEHGNHLANCRTMEKRLRIRLLWALAARHAAKFFCVASEIAESISAYRVVPRRKVAVVPNGIDTASFADASGALALRQSLGIPSAALVIGTIGRLNEVKRQDLLIRAFAEVLNQVPEAHLLLVGDGPERESLGRLTDELKIAQSVHFAGYQTRPQDFLHVMNIFALTSRTEGMPLVILEAWAAGLPVVASRVGGIPKLVDQDQNGLLFDSGDQDALMVALTDLATHPDRAKSLGEAGCELVKSRFDTRVMAAAYERQYREILAKSGK